MRCTDVEVEEGMEGRSGGASPHPRPLPPAAAMHIRGVRKKEMELKEAEATLRTIKAQVEDTKRCIEGLRLQKQQTDREERRAQINYKLEEGDRKLIRLFCKETYAEQKLGEIRSGLHESPDELFASDKFPLPEGTFSIGPDSIDFEELDLEVFRLQRSPPGCRCHQQTVRTTEELITKA
ncbi:sensory histidine kinase [Lasius niger]|uniref:Sensory histidine kinase n=1 Tax=Lasius niger TaxID=67767 RepID=A0A0J7KFD8_LASNI|nr:sensory histidine kinase [Lasius niger]